MQEIDIWIKAFQKLGFRLDDESHNRHTGINCIKYTQTTETCGTQHHYLGPGRSNVQYFIYFKFDTGRVTDLQFYNMFNERDLIVTKERFLELNKDLFREVKLSELI